jgi:threonine synthase
VRPNSVAKSLAIGNPADGDLAIATARRSGGAIYAVPEDEVGQNMAFLAENAGIFGETAAGVTIGALRVAAERGDIGPGDRVVALVTGTGLKTPQVVENEASGALVEIEADLDALLEELGVVA